MKEESSSTKYVSCRNYSFSSEAENFTSPENFGRKLRQSVYAEINLPPISNLLDSIHSAASHAYTQAFALVAGYLLPVLGCFLKASYCCLRLCFCGCPVCHQSYAGARQKGTIRESSHVHHLPDIGQVLHGLGFFFGFWLYVWFLQFVSLGRNTW